MVLMQPRMYLLQHLRVAELPAGGVRELKCPRGSGRLVHSQLVDNGAGRWRGGAGAELWLIWRIDSGGYEVPADATNTISLT